MPAMPLARSRIGITNVTIGVCVNAGALLRQQTGMRFNANGDYTTKANF
jgi:hypothetical protein